MTKTPLERAKAIVDEFTDNSTENINKRLVDAIHKAIIEATNEEVQRRRDLENQLSHFQAGGPVLFTSAKGVTSLLWWNKETNSWFEVQMTEVKRG